MRSITERMAGCIRAFGTVICSGIIVHRMDPYLASRSTADFIDGLYDSGIVGDSAIIIAWIVKLKALLAIPKWRSRLRNGWMVRRPLTKDRMYPNSVLNVLTVPLSSCPLASREALKASEQICSPCSIMYLGADREATIAGTMTGPQTCMKKPTRENTWALHMKHDHITSNSTVVSGPGGWNN